MQLPPLKKISFNHPEIQKCYCSVSLYIVLTSQRHMARLGIFLKVFATLFNANKHLKVRFKGK